MKSIKPRKQRKMLYNAPLHKKRKWLASHLAENLLLKYDQRSIPVVKGDTIKVMRGSFKGHEDKVALVHVRKQIIEVEGITTVKADGTKIARPIHPSNVIVTKLNLTDKWRRKTLERGLSEETKKEIESEAEQQIKEAEGEVKEMKELDEEIIKKPEEPEETEKLEEKPKPKVEVKKVEKKTAPKAKPKKEETITPKTKKTTSSKKKAEKKEIPAKKKVTKKTSSKTTKKKEEDEK